MPTRTSVWPGGKARRSPCPGEARPTATVPAGSYTYTEEDGVHGKLANLADLNSADPADLSPLVFQSGGTTSTPGAQKQTKGYAKNTTVLEQPLDFTTLADKRTPTNRTRALPCPGPSLGIAVRCVAGTPS